MDIIDAQSIQYKRETSHRIFVVRSLQMEKIKFFGFDMDYTLASYTSPTTESETFDIVKEQLISIGYPEDIRSYNYDASFPVRGLWFDKELGTLLKMDQFGNILLAIHGFRILTPQELRARYPNKFMKLDEGRFYVMNTLFNLPETHMLACLVDYFCNHADFTVTEKGVRKGTLLMSYRSIYQDVRAAIDWMHDSGILKAKTLENLEKFVERDSRLPVFLHKLRLNGSKVFLLTNSEYDYTNKIMEFILDFPDDKGNKIEWSSYFDYVVVNARKPLFFKEGTILRSVDKKTGRLNIGRHVGPLEKGQIYSGGSCEVFSELIGARGKDVLYVGDHIFGDILKSKKIVGWRTYLVIPELANEIYVWVTKKELFEKLQNLNTDLAIVYKDMDIASQRKPDVESTQNEIKNVALEMEQAYGVLGSLFRNGSRHTFFSSQVMRYADLYSHSCLNLMYYPLCYMFRAPPMLMPHESTVPHDDDPDDLDGMAMAAFSRQGNTTAVESENKRSNHEVHNGDTGGYDSERLSLTPVVNKLIDSIPMEYDQNSDPVSNPRD